MEKREEVCHWRQIHEDAMDNPTGRFNKDFSPAFFYFFWELWWKCVRQVCGHLCGRQGLRFLGAAARLEKAGVDDYLTKTALVDDTAAHLLSFPVGAVQE